MHKHKIGADFTLINWTVNEELGFISLKTFSGKPLKFFMLNCFFSQLFGHTVQWVLVRWLQVGESNTEFFQWFGLRLDFCEKQAIIQVTHYISFCLRLKSSWPRILTRMISSATEKKELYELELENSLVFWASSLLALIFQIYPLSLLGPMFNALSSYLKVLYSLSSTVNPIKKLSWAIQV